MNNRGSVLILGLLIMSILLLFGWIFLSLTLTNYSTLIVSSNDQKAYWIAHAGIKKAIYNIRDDYGKYMNEIKRYDFSDGEYEIAITNLDTTGVREILCVCKGIYQNSSYSMIVEIQLDTPTDYLYFFDGNGAFGGPEMLSDIDLAGPIHSNAHFLATTYRGHIWIIKPSNITGPLISTAGLITRGTYYEGSFAYLDDHPDRRDGGTGKWVPRIGEGQISFDQNFKYTGSTPDKLLNFQNWGFKVWNRPGTGDIYYSSKMTYPDDFLNSNWAKNPVNPSPSETFPRSNTPLGLLNDAYHGGYRIPIPTIRKVTSGTKYKATEYSNLLIKTDSEWDDEIRKLYANYIDNRWFIRGKKLTDSHENKYYEIEDTKGLKTKEFINDSLKRKFVIGRGNGANTQFTIPGHYVSEVEKIGKQNASGSLDTFKYFPSMRRVKNVYFNGSNVNLQSGWTFSAYYNFNANSYVVDGGWRPGHSKIAFDMQLDNSDQPYNKKNIKVRFTGQPFVIGRGDGVTRNFEYYPGTISKVYVYDPNPSYPGWKLKTEGAAADYTLAPLTTYSGRTLTTTDNINYYEPDGNNFAKLFRSEPLEVYRDGVLIYRLQAGVRTDNTGDVSISSINYPEGKVTFSSSQTGVITANYTAGRTIKFNVGSQPPVTSLFSVGNVGIDYSGNITVAESYGSFNSTGSGPGAGPAREFNFWPQNSGNKITKVTVGTASGDKDAFYITADYYAINSDNWGEIKFLNPPPPNTIIGTDFARAVYLINESSPKVFSPLVNDLPPVYYKPDVIDNKAGPYRWYDYTISGNIVNIYNTGASSTGYIYATYPVVPGPEPVPVPSGNSFVCVDPSVKAVVIDLGSISPSPEKGVIFSEVPVIVKGVAKEPILIVCLGNIYLQSINSGFSDDSDEVSPVGILSTGAVWVDHNGAYELDENHPQDIYYDVILNKVAIYTTRGFYYTGGRFFKNRKRLVGSVCILSDDFGSFVDERDMSEQNYIDQMKSWWIYTYPSPDVFGPGSATSGNAQLYATSFRADKTTSSSSNHRPPPHMPVYIQIKYFKSSSESSVQNFIDTVRTYINDKKKISKELYNELITKL